MATASASARRGWVEPHERRIRHEPREDRGDDDVDDRAEDERPDDADGHVAPRVLALLGARRDGVEADVGEEDDGRARPDPGEAVRRERVPVLRPARSCAQARTKKASTTSFTPTMTALKRADSFTPQTRTMVTTATMTIASALKTMGTPEDVRRARRGAPGGLGGRAVVGDEPPRQVDAQAAQEARRRTAHEMATAVFPMAYSRRRSQPMIHATSSPSVA